jgi:cytochrome c peroxidase
MFSKKAPAIIFISFFSLLFFFSDTVFSQEPFTDQENLGKMLFFDTNLSEPAGQACASCHDPNAGFSEPDINFPVSEGVILGRFGNRNSPSAAYATFTPIFEPAPPNTIGGQFWDGRAADLTEQAKGPFLNPVEMNNLTRAQVIVKIEISDYADLFELVCGSDAFLPENVDSSYHCMAEAIAAYEGTEDLNKFNSRFDAYEADLVELTPSEQRGKDLFRGSAKCTHCHPVKVPKGEPILFTDFDYHNLGLPKNLIIPAYAQNPDLIDNGLGAITGDPRDNGKFKTPHLRNIDLTPPFMHNGVLRTLKEVVHFYNTRDVLPEVCVDNLDPGFGITCWPPAEVPENADGQFMGNLGLTDQEEDDIVNYMLTFTDGFVIP